MLEVWIVVAAEVDATGELVAASPLTALMVKSMACAIASHPVKNAIARLVSVSEVETLYSKFLYTGNLPDRPQITEILLSPVTLNFSPSFSFPQQSIYQACRDVVGLRHQVEQELGCATGVGDLWLPVVLTSKGPIYGEAIGLSQPQAVPEDLSLPSLSYTQPIHLSDAKRQLLYELGYNLLQLLQASPATYLLQFGLAAESIYFDRLWPFPAAPAIASLGIQSPNLFTCHWKCLTEQPLLDLEIIPVRGEL